jgi:hypothetical protein
MVERRNMGHHYREDFEEAIFQYLVAEKGANYNSLCQNDLHLTVFKRISPNEAISGEIIFLPEDMIVHYWDEVTNEQKPINKEEILIALKRYLGHFSSICFKVFLSRGQDHFGLRSRKLTTKRNELEIFIN